MFDGGNGKRRERRSVFVVWEGALAANGCDAGPLAVRIASGDIRG